MQNGKFIFNIVDSASDFEALFCLTKSTSFFNGNFLKLLLKIKNNTK